MKMLGNPTYCTFCDCRFHVGIVIWAQVSCVITLEIFSCFSSPCYELARLKLGTKWLVWLSLPEPEALFEGWGWKGGHGVPFHYVAVSTEIWLHALEHCENMEVFLFYLSCVELLNMKLSDSCIVPECTGLYFLTYFKYGSGIAKYFLGTMVSNCVYA